MKVLLALGLAATAQAQDLAAILTPEGLTNLGCDLTACAPLVASLKNFLYAMMKGSIFFELLYKEPYESNFFLFFSASSNKGSTK